MRNFQKMFSKVTLLKETISHTDCSYISLSSSVMSYQLNNFFGAFKS